MHNPTLARMLPELKAVLAEKFGEGSHMYEKGLAVLLDNALNGGVGYGIPTHYAEYWEPYQTRNILHHITTKKYVDAIRKRGLEPRDPSPRPWAGMKAVYMGEPSDALYGKSQHAVIDHVRKKRRMRSLAPN